MNSAKISSLEREISSLRSSGGYLYAGYPKFMALFGRDSIISSLELINYDPQIAISTLKALSALQGKKLNVRTGEYPGKILHEFYDDTKFYNLRKEEIPWLQKGPSYFSVDSTPLFVILLSRLKPADIGDHMDELESAAIKATSFMIKYAIKGHFMSYEKAIPGMGLQSQSWRDGIGDILDRLKSPVYVIGVQGYAYNALEQMKKIMGQRRGDLTANDSGFLNSIEMHMAEIRNNLENYFWIDDTSYYALASDGDGVAQRSVTSDPGHLLFSGILPRKRERDVIDRMFEDDLMTDYGVRTLASSDPSFDPKAYQRGSIWPQDNWIIARGLKERGYAKEYSEIRKRLLEAYDRMGKLPEYFSVTKDGKLLNEKELRITPCYPQAWSSGAILDFIISGR